MFEIRLNDQLKRHLEVLRKDNADEGITSLSDQILEKGSVSMEALIKLYNDQLKNRVSLQQLLSPLEFKFKEKHVPGANYKPEFKQQLQRLKLQQQETDYQQLIKKSGPPGATVADEDMVTPAQMHREVKEQVTTVFNILVSVVSVSFALWYWSGSSSGMALHYRVLISLFFGILVLIAEVVVYNSYLQRVSDARAREKCKKERKKVVKKIII